MRSLHLAFSLSLVVLAATNLLATESWAQTSSNSTPIVNSRAVRYYGWMPVEPSDSTTSEPPISQEAIPVGSEVIFEQESAQTVPSPAAQPFSPNPPAFLQEEPAVPTVPPSSGAVISEVQVRFLNEEGQRIVGVTRPYIITREFALMPGDLYNPDLALQGLEQVLALNGIRDASISLEPTANSNQVVMVVNVVERPFFETTMGAQDESPSALQGSFQPRSVGPGANEVTEVGMGGTTGFRNLGGNDQDLLLRIRGAEQAIDAELSFTDPQIAGDSQQTGYSVNLFAQQSVQGVFVGGDRDVDLRGGRDPWVYRFGGGVEVFRPLSPNLNAALGLSYQEVSVRDGAFNPELQIRDERGNPLTVSPTGQDDLLTLRFATDYDRRDNPESPTQGTRVLAGIDQTIPVGDANIAFTRITGNYTEFFPVSLTEFAEGTETLVLNLQAGTMFGDVPPYEAFNLDAGPIQSFGGLDIGTGSSFALAAAEYRFPIANFTVFEQPINLGGAMFGGYISDLGTADEVIGNPAEARGKPGDSIGYGIGLRADTPIGLIRLELGFSEEGSEVVVTTGDRF